MPNSFLQRIVFLSIMKASLTLKSLALKNLSRITSVLSSLKKGTPQIEISSGNEVISVVGATICDSVSWVSVCEAGGGVIELGSVNSSAAAAVGGGGGGEVNSFLSMASLSSCFSSSSALFSISDRSPTLLLSSLKDTIDSGIFFDSIGFGFSGSITAASWVAGAGDFSGVSVTSFSGGGGGECGVSFSVTVTDGGVEGGGSTSSTATTAAGAGGAAVSGGAGVGFSSAMLEGRSSIVSAGRIQQKVFWEGRISGGFAF